MAHLIFSWLPTFTPVLPHVMSIMGVKGNEAGWGLGCSALPCARHRARTRRQGRRPVRSVGVDGRGCRTEGSSFSPPVTLARSTAPHLWCAGQAGPRRAMILFSVTISQVQVPTHTHPEPRGLSRSGQGTRRQDLSWTVKPPVWQLKPEEGLLHLAKLLASRGAQTLTPLPGSVGFHTPRGSHRQL